jgi:peptidoglycan/LPS O-acetylase OafA/YrhL
VWISSAAATFLYAGHFASIEKTEKLESWNIIASLLLLPQTQPALVNATWTLTYEVFFYSLFALLIANRQLGLAALLAWQGAVLLAAAGAIQPPHWLAAYYLQPLCLEFGIGMLCAVAVSRGRHGLLARREVQLGLLALGASVFLGGLIHEGLSQRHVLEPVRVLVYGLGPGATILALATLERSTPLRVPAALVWFGSVSYTVYLVNFSVISLAGIVLLQLRVVPPGIASLLTCVVLAVAVGGAFHAWVDRPIQQYLRRVGRLLFDSSSQPVPLVRPAAALPPRGRAPQ